MDGRAIAHFKVLDEVGRGAMGVVYRAHDEKLDRDVALKVLPEGATGTLVDRRRFRNEALALSRVNHPNIAVIHDLLTHDGIDVLVMEYIPGATLGDQLRAAPLAFTQIRHLAVQLVEGLEAAHAQGVIHRDLKPSNIRVTPDGRLKILDFGLARFRHPPEAVTTRTGSDRAERLAGTLPYLAPELLGGHLPDLRTDVYSAGAVLYEMAVGRPPFTRPSEAALVAAILEDRPGPPSAANPNVPESYDAIVMKALDKNPEQRYQSAGELLADLRRLPGSQDGAPVPTPAPAQVPALPPRPRVRRWITAAAAVATMVAVVVGLVTMLDRGRSQSFRERDWVLVADLEASGPEIDTARVVRSALDLALQQSNYVNVLPRERIFDAKRRMRREDAERIDEALGLEICRREGVRILLAGNIVRSANDMVISLKALDPDTGGSVFAIERAVPGSRDVFEAVDGLAATVRERLGESLDRISASRAPLARVTTGSLDALQAYSAAVDEVARGKNNVAQVLLDNALQHDPDFAMAHRLIAQVYFVRGHRELELQHIERAHRLRDTVTTRERYFIESSYRTSQEQYEQAVEQLEALTRLYPDDLAGHRDLAVAYRDAGNAERGVEEYRRVLALSPASAAAHGDLALTLARTNRNQEAVDLAREAVERGLDSPRLRRAWGMASLGLGDRAAARAQFEKMRGFEPDDSIAGLLLARVTIYEGRFRQAESELRARIDTDARLQRRSPELLGRYLLARVLVEQRRIAPARQELAHILASGEPPLLQAEELRRAGGLLADIGDLDRAREALARLEQLRRERPTAFNDACFHLLTGAIALGEDRPREALEAFELAGRAYPHFAVARDVARAAEALSEWRHAADAWQQFLTGAGQVLQDGFSAEVPLAQLALGRLHRRLGDAARAKARYEAFLAAWNAAEDLPVQREALEEWKSLTGGDAHR